MGFGNYLIKKFTPDGVGTVFASTGLNLPGHIAFTDDFGVPLKLANQVPEPATGVLLGVSAALVLGCVRRWR